MRLYNIINRLPTVWLMTAVKILVVNNVFYLINSVGDFLNNDSLMPFIASFHNNLESFIPLQISVTLTCLSQGEKSIINKYTCTSSPKGFV